MCILPTAGHKQLHIDQHVGGKAIWEMEGNGAQAVAHQSKGEDEYTEDMETRSQHVVNTAWCNKRET